MTGTRGSHIELKMELHLCSAAPLSAATVIDGSKVFGVYSAPAYKVIIDDTVESIPPTFYNVLYHKSHFFASFFSKLGSLCMQLRLSSYALTFPAPLSSSSYAIFG